MEQYDTVIIGGGMAGLSTAAFLAQGGQHVVVLEKHDRPGGLTASFSLKGVPFDIGLEGLMELAPESYLGQFLKWWGIELPLATRDETIAVHTARAAYRFRGTSLQEDFRAAFPAARRQVDRFFEINRRIVTEMTGGGAPKPPYEMNIFEKLLFGLSTAFRKPNLLRYGLKNCSRVFPALFDDPELIRAAASKTVDELVYLSVAYRWGAVASGRIMTPIGGMRAVPDAMAAAIRKRGSEVLTRAEAVRVQESAAGGWAVETQDGRCYTGRRLVVAAPMPWAVFSLFRDDTRFDGWRRQIRRRAPFPASFMTFVALDPGYDLGGANYIMDWGPDTGYPALWTARKAGRELDAATAPILCVVGNPAPGKNSPVPLSIMTTLGWDYSARWGTANLPTDGWLAVPPGYHENENYCRLKNEAEEIILRRLAGRLGRGFRDAILFSAPSTPLSFARYTNNPAGSYMGFSIRAGEYGQFFPQQSPVPGVSFAGHWVFPGFGVATVAASGYYLARSILAVEGTDLNQILAEVK